METVPEPIDDSRDEFRLPLMHNRMYSHPVREEAVIPSLHYQV